LILINANKKVRGNEMKNKTRTNLKRQRGFAMNKATLTILGLALIVVGALLKGQAWTKPEILSPLGLDLAKTIVGIGYFLLFIQIIDLFFFAPLRQAISERDSTIEATFDEAENLKANMMQLKEAYEKRLAESEQEARERIQAALKEAQAMKDNIINEAKQQADGFLKRAEEEIQMERDKMLIELRTKVADMTMIATERIIGKTADEQKQRQLVRDFIESMEAKN
jgi:F-type H+-transporting ATPase subunit b